MQADRPTALIVVAGIFIALGLNGLAMTIIGISHGTGGADFSTLNLLVGVGLLRRDPMGRRLAIGVCWLTMIGTAIPLLYLVLGAPWRRSSSIFGQPLYQIPRGYLLAFVLANFTITVWVLRILHRPTVRVLFASPEPEAMTLRLVAATVFAVVSAVSCAVGLTCLVLWALDAEGGGASLPTLIAGVTALAEQCSPIKGIERCAP